METTKNRTDMFSKVLRIVYVALLLVHLLLWALNAVGQTVGRLDESSNLSGTNGPASVSRLFNSHSGKGFDAVDQQRRLVGDIYTSQIGVREKQPNSGPEVEKYLRYVNLPKGYPWCAAFVCWVFGEAGVSNPRTGWSPGLFGASRVIWERGESGKVKGEGQRKGAQSLKHKAPGRSDVFGLYFPEKGRIAHVGFIDEWKDPWVVTVEGNTNVLGSREGDGVYRKRRLVRSVFRVARYVE